VTYSITEYINHLQKQVFKIYDVIVACRGHLQELRNIKKVQLKAVYYIDTQLLKLRIA